MIFLIPIMFLSLMLSGCDGAGDKVAPPTASDLPANGSGGQADPDKPLASVMRPSVVAETEAVAEPEIPEPVKMTVPFGEFGTGLSDEARSALDALLATPAASAQSRIVIRGHSDSRGHDEQNLIASRKRAEAVRDYLLTRGVPESRMTVIAVGEARPIAPNATPGGLDFEEGRQRNRRAEVEIVPETPAPE